MSYRFLECYIYLKSGENAVSGLPPAQKELRHVAVEITDTMKSIGVE
jgi:hypothetical protein